MPNRYVREDILDSDRVDALSAEAEVFYRRLMNKADDYGRFHGDWRKLRAALYPLRVEKITEKFIERLLVECNQVIDGRPLVTIYFSEGRRYLEITNFKQQIRSDSKFPSSNSVEKPSDRICVSDDRSCSQVRSDTDTDTDSDSLSSSNSVVPFPETKTVSEVEQALDRNSERIHTNHPSPRRDIGPGQVRHGLKKILRHKSLVGAAAVKCLDDIGDRHDRMCQSDQWTKEGGEYAKGLNNWLAPTIERYDQEPPSLLPARASPVRDVPPPDKRPLNEVFLR